MKFGTSPMTLLTVSLDAAFWNSSMEPHSIVACTEYGESSPILITFQDLSPNWVQLSATSGMCVLR